jgi:hypothetical protein
MRVLVGVVDVHQLPSGEPFIICNADPGAALRPLLMKHVILTFDKKWLPRVAHLKRGDRLAAEGRIHKVNGGAVILEDCEPIGQS